MNIKNSNTIFVSGLNYTTTAEEIKEVFSNCGTISSINFPTYQDSGRSRGYCHIEFASESEARNSLQLNKTDFKGRYMDVSIGKGLKEKTNLSKEEVRNFVTQNKKTIFVKNLPYDATADEIGSYFKPCGKIENVRMVNNYSNKNFKGFCYVDFVKPESVYAAAKLSGSQFRDRYIQIDLEEKAPRKGYRVSTENPSIFEKTALKAKALKERKIVKKQIVSKGKTANQNIKESRSEYKNKIANLNIFK